MKRGMFPGRSARWEKPRGKTCYLCDVGHAPRSKKHGVAIGGVGMVDTACPITKTEYDRVLAECRQLSLLLSAPEDKPQ